MNNKEFLEEVINSSKCPENFKQVYTVFEKMQLYTLDTLKEFHKVCEANNIPYQLAYGSLLGAIRDNGQIPWDYDVDVFVPYDKKQCLVDALKRDLDKDYYFYCPEISSKCRHYIMRVCPKQFRSEGLHVDVFYIIGAPDDKNERDKFKKQVRLLSKIRFHKLVNCREESAGNKRRFFSLLMNKLRYFFVPLKWVDAEHSKLCERYNIGNADILVEASTFSCDFDFPRAWLESTIIYCCSNGDYRVPENYEEVLTLLFGNYKSIPALETRIQAVLYNYGRFVSFTKGII